MPSQPVGTQLERLLSVLDALPQRRRAVTTQQLFQAQDWGVDVRTLQRDLKTLEKLGLAERRAPARDDLEDSRSERWCSIARNAPSRPRLTTEQAIAFSLLERLSASLLPKQVAAALRDQFDEARTHLKAQWNVDKRTRWTEKVEIISDTFTRKAVEVKPAVLRNLQKALLTDMRVLARYCSRARGRGKKYVLEPRGLVQLGPTLFLIATQPSKPDYPPAWYAVHRFVSARVLPTRCAGSAFSLKNYLERGGADFGTSGAPIAFKAWVSKDLKRTLREAPLSKDMKVRSDKSGGAIVTATVRRSWPFQRWLLSRGPDLEVIEPPELREYMVSKLDSALRAYGDAANDFGKRAQVENTTAETRPARTASHEAGAEAGSADGEPARKDVENILDRMMCGDHRFWNQAGTLHPERRRRVTLADMDRYSRRMARQFEADAKRARADKNEPDQD